MRNIIAVMSWASLAASAAAFVASPWSQAALLAFRYSDPFAISQYRLAHLGPSEYAEHAQRALDENDIEDAQAIADMAVQNGIELPPEIQDQLYSFHREWLLKNSLSFGKGFVTGSVDSLSEISGSMVSDFLVVGDLRDASVNGYGLATGGDYDTAVLALSMVGIATTAAYVVPGTQGADPAVSAFKTSVKIYKRLSRSGGGLESGVVRQVADAATQAIDLNAARRLFSSSTMSSLIKTPSVSQAREALIRLRGSSPLDMRPADIKKAFGGLLPYDTKRLADEAKGVFRPDSLAPLLSMTSGVSAVANAGGIKAAMRVVRVSDNVADTQFFAKLATRTGKETSAIVRVLGKNAIRFGNLIWTVAAALLTVVGWLVWFGWLMFKTTRFAVRLIARVARA